MLGDVSQTPGGQRHTNDLQQQLLTIIINIHNTSWQIADTGSRMVVQNMSEVNQEAQVSVKVTGTLEVTFFKVKNISYFMPGWSPV